MSGLSAEISSIVNEAMAQGVIGGGVVLVQQNGQLVDLQAHGHADFDPSFKIGTDSVFGIMSMTKPFAAACAMILLSEGRLKLDDKVSQYIPEFSKPRIVRTLKPGYVYPPFPPIPGQPPAAEPEYDTVPARADITVRHILSFTSGLQTIGVPNGLPVQGPEDTLASYVAKLGDAPLEFEPGTQWHYSNATGYDILGRIIEVASGVSFPDFARTRLLEPLGMNQTRFGNDPAHADQTVPLGPLADTPVARPDYPSGSAGLFSTAEDYARFAQMLLDGGLWQGKRVMAAEAVVAMQTDQLGDVPFEGIRVSQYAKPVHSRHTAFTYGYGVGILKQQSPDEALPEGSFGWDGVGTRRFWVVPALRLVIVMLMPGLGVEAEPVHKQIEAAVVRWAKTATD